MLAAGHRRRHCTFSRRCRVEGCGGQIVGGLGARAKVSWQVVGNRVVDLSRRRLVLESARAELFEFLKLHGVEFDLLSLRRSHLDVGLGRKVGRIRLELVGLVAKGEEGGALVVRVDGCGRR